MGKSGDFLTASETQQDGAPARGKLHPHEPMANMRIFIFLILGVILVPLIILMVSNALERLPKAATTTTIPPAQTTITTTTATQTTMPQETATSTTSTSQTTSTTLIFECETDADCQDVLSFGCKIGSYYRFKVSYMCVGHRCFEKDVSTEMVTRCFEGERCDNESGCVPEAGATTTTTSSL